LATTTPFAFARTVGVVVVYEVNAALDIRALTHDWQKTSTFMQFAGFLFCSVCAMLVK
jgi:hypothetical protein